MHTHSHTYANKHTHTHARAHASAYVAGVFHGERAEAPCNLMELRNKTMAFAALSLGPARAHALPQRRRVPPDPHPAGTWPGPTPA